MFPNGTYLFYLLLVSRGCLRILIGLVHGVDLYPPPVDWTPPNCIIEVDDILQEWTWRERFDLIYMRNMLASFDRAQWASVYKQCYEYGIGSLHELAIVHI